MKEITNFDLFSKKYVLYIERSKTLSLYGNILMSYLHKMSLLREYEK
jgi:hypothetical protein